MENVGMQFSLKELRARKNVRQSDVAKALGVSTQTYCMWERDISKVAISRVVKLAEYFGVGIGEILIYPRT